MDNEQEVYTPNDDIRKFILDKYSDFLQDKNIKDSSQPILGGKTLQKFWNDSCYDYNVLVENKTEDDPVTPYASTISRDKANTFISNLTLQLLYPSVTAQNENQEIDQVVSKISRSILEWAYNNDGRPAENGHLKAVRYTHKQVVEGTVHIQDDMIDGQLSSQCVPNEEIYIPNFWQPNIQLQSHIFRVQNNILYAEAEQQFGQLDNWHYVIAGEAENWNIDAPLFKDRYSGIVEQGKVQIIYMHYDIPQNDFKKYKIPKRQKKAKLFNILINGIPMYPIDNVSPYKHGNYNINKGIFEYFSKSEYYWGNSMPNKASKDKKWLDGWKTLIRHKAKMSVIPPLITYNGQFIDQDIFIPGQVTKAPAAMKPEDVAVVPGVATGLDNADFAIMKEARDEIDAGNLSPQARGGEGKQQTAREAIIRETNEQKILGAFGLQVAFLVEARTFPILKMLFQFLPRKTIKQLAIPHQELSEGREGTLEIIFKKPPEMNQEERFQASLDIRAEEQASIKAGNSKKRVFVNPAYLNNINLYITAVADVLPKKTSALRRAEAMEKYTVYRADPENFNSKPSARNLVRELGDNEEEIINTEPSQQSANIPQTGGVVKKAEGMSKLGELNT